MIANLKIEPALVRRGEQAILTIEVGDDIIMKGSMIIYPEYSETLELRITDGERSEEARARVTVI